MSQQTCATCKHMKDFDPSSKRPPSCTRFPPQTHFILVPRPAKASVQLSGGPQMVPVEEQRSAFPLVQPDWSCGEWTAKLTS